MTRALCAAAFALVLASLGAACGDDDSALLSREALMDPETCKDCHPQHYREWKSSMHAYAADDPVFLAMNQRGQEETDGALGDFCVSCHAPLAVREGYTVDGTDLDQVPAQLKGVTCYFCHQVMDVPEPHHNNPLVLADDGVLRGALDAPVANGAHLMAYSPYHDRKSPKSAELCGACHDIVTPAGVHLERTFVEWQESIFASGGGLQRLTCGQCHMKGDRPGVVADFPDVPLRLPHEHSWPGIDVAVTAWPDIELQREQIARELDPAINPKLCVTPNDGGVIEYVLDNVGSGHDFPSGAAQDRRAWAEVVAFSAGGVVYESGVVAADQPVAEVAAVDDDLWQMRDFVYGEDGEPVHMFWDVRSVVGDKLPSAVTTDPLDPRYDHSVARFYPLLGKPVDRVTAVAYIRPIGLDVLDDLVASGHLDAAHRDTITHTIEGTRLEWTLDGTGYGCVCRNGPCSR